ncbi:MAG: hypothetical protein ACLQBY_05280 [Solirubrobacteraceae bacterium]
MRASALLPLLAAVVSLAIGPAGAMAAPADVTATQAYVQANYALVRVASSHLAASEAGPLHVLAQVQRECPQAGAQSPQDAESTQMSDEVIGAMVIAAAQPDLPAMRTFVHAASSLSWSSHSLTGAIRGYVGEVKTILGLPAPNLCGDVRAWSAGGFHALPASTVAFAGKFMPAWVALGYLPPQLTPFESSAAKGLARRCNPLEEQLTEGEARAVAHYGEIMDALAIWP